MARAEAFDAAQDRVPYRPFCSVHAFVTSSGSPLHFLISKKLPAATSRVPTHRVNGKTLSTARGRSRCRCCHASRRAAFARPMRGAAPTFAPTTPQPNPRAGTPAAFKSLARIAARHCGNVCVATRIRAPIGTRAAAPAPGGSRAVLQSDPQLLSKGFDHTFQGVFTRPQKCAFLPKRERSGRAWSRADPSENHDEDAGQTTGSAPGRRAAAKRARRRMRYRDFTGGAANSAATSTLSANAILSSDSNVGFAVASSRALISAWRKRVSSARSYWDHDRSRRSCRRLRASKRLVRSGSRSRRLIRQDDASRWQEQNTL